MQVKDECEPGFSYWTLKTVSGLIKVTHRSDLCYANTSDTDTLLCPFGVRIREVRLYIALIFKIWSMPVGNEEWVKGFEPIRNCKIFWMNNDKHLMTGFEGNSEAGNSLNLSVMAVVSQHLRVTVQCYPLTS